VCSLRLPSLQLFFGMSATPIIRRMYDTSLLEARILSRFRWAECEPVGGGAEILDAGWLAPVLKCRNLGRELSCISNACVCYTLSPEAQTAHHRSPPDFEETSGGSQKHPPLKRLPRATSSLLSEQRRWTPIPRVQRPLHRRRQSLIKQVGRPQSY
jgi:hypothetical protein